MNAIEKDELLTSINRAGEGLNLKPNFTGQINIEVHLKDGKVKAVYTNQRSKIRYGQSNG